MRVSKSKLSELASVDEEYKNYRSNLSVKVKDNLNWAERMFRKNGKLTDRPKLKHQQLWKEYMTVQNVSRRIWAGVPDYVCFRSEWLSAMLQERKYWSMSAIMFFGWLVRFGYWDDEGRLILSSEIYKELRIANGLKLKKKHSSGTMHKYILELCNMEILKKVNCIRHKNIYEVNPLLCVFMDEDDLGNSKILKHKKSKYKTE